MQCINILTSVQKLTGSQRRVRHCSEMIRGVTKENKRERNNKHKNTLSLKYVKAIWLVEFK